MTFDNFILEYDTSGNKDKFLEERIKTRYISFATKCDACQRIIDATSYVTIGDKKTFRSDSPTRYFLFMLMIVSNYTDIDIFGDNAVYAYDELTKRDIFKKILISIGDREYTEFNSILSMKLDDIAENERSIVSYIDGKYTSFSYVIDEILNNLEKTNGKEGNVDVE